MEPFHSRFAGVFESFAWPLISTEEKTKMSEFADSTTILAVEGGGTKTRAWLAVGDPAAPRVLASRDGGPSNAQTNDPMVVARLVRELLDQLLADAGLSRDRISVLSMGMAGVSSDQDRLKLLSALATCEMGEPVTLTSDVRAVLMGASQGDDAIVLIAGTGSIAWGVSRTGKEARSGGWGSGVGDEGSGHAIGREALKRISWMLDGRARPFRLAKTIQGFLGLSDTAELGRWIRENGHRPREVARVARAVTAVVGTDPTARAILVHAADDLVRLVRSVQSSLALPDQVRVVLYGGLLIQSVDYQRMVRERIGKALSDANVTTGDPDLALRGLVFLGHQKLAQWRPM